MSPISPPIANVALQLLAIFLYAFCPIECCGQDNQLPGNLNRVTRRSQREFDLTAGPENNRTDFDPIEMTELEFDWDEGDEEQSAISFDSIYTGEIFSNTRGGLSTNDATQYQGLLDLMTTVELDQTRIPLPGKFAMLVQNTHGRGLTEEFIGDAQVISNIDSGDNIMQVSEYWWQFDLIEENVTVRLGKQDLNSDFLVMGLAADFIQSSFGLSPSVGFPSYPNPSMAAVLLAQLRPSLQMKLGVWDAFADGGGWGFSDNDLTYVFAELESRYALNRGMLKGSLDLGAGYVTEGELDGANRSSGYGVYFQMEQLVYRENSGDEEDDQGLGVFVSYFPKFSKGPIPLSAINDNFVGGIVYQGLIPGHDADVIGCGVAWAQLNQGGTSQETVTEVFYKAQMTATMSIQPDIQYIASPSGIHRDALAVGIRFQWSPDILR